VQSKFNQGLFYKEKPRRIHTIPLYTAPPDVKHWKDLAEYRLQLLMKMPENKSWQGLTDEGIDDAWRILAILSDKGLQELRREYARAIEAKLKEKNT
jgi:hypothetical protein